MSLRRFSIVFLSFLVVVAVGLVAGYFFLPWKAAIEHRLVLTLEATGLQDVQLAIDRIDPHGIVLKDVSFGRPARLELQNITVGYSWLSLYHRRISDVTLQGMDLHITQQPDESWVMDGVAKTPKQDSTADDTVTGTFVGPPITATGFRLPVSRAELDGLPLEKIALTQSGMDILAQTWNAHVPLELNILKGPQPHVGATGNGTGLHYGAITVTTGTLSFGADLDEAKASWHGNWILDKVMIAGFDPAPPPLQATGIVDAAADHIAIEGDLTSPDKAYRGSFKLNYFYNEPTKSTLTFTDLAMPWEGGALHIAKITMPLWTPKDQRVIDATLDVEHISIAAITQQLAGQHVSANGTLSGAVPVVFGPGDAINFNQGHVASDGPGVLIAQPDLLASDNPQLKILHDLLSNFHYTALSATIDGGKDTPLAVALHIEGGNPDAYQGHEVKLNVNLGGDVLNLVRQNLQLLTDPKTFIEQGKYAHP